MVGVSRIGSSLSLRSFSRLGSAMSVLDFVHLGSTLSVRSMMRLGSNLKLASGGKLKFGSDTTYIQSANSDAELRFYANAGRAMTITSTGGTLHGTWTADAVISTSDRRLKTNIKDLTTTIEDNHMGQVPARDGTAAPHRLAGAGDEGAAGRQTSMSWLLREMRPVSYNFKKGPEAKYVRFGFIADELEQVVPQVVRTLPQDQQGVDGQEEPRKGVVYPDLIAVLTAAVKDFGQQMQGLSNRLQVAEAELDRLDQIDDDEEEEEENEDDVILT